MNRLPSEPDRVSFQDVALFAHPANLTAKTTQLLALRGARPDGSTPIVALGLHDPVADRLRRRLELPWRLLLADRGRDLGPRRVEEGGYGETVTILRLAVNCEDRRAISPYKPLQSYTF